MWHQLAKEFGCVISSLALLFSALYTRIIQLQEQEDETFQKVSSMTFVNDLVMPVMRRDKTLSGGSYRI